MVSDSLTTKEREIVSLIARGMRCTEIAEALGAAPMTVRKHRSNIVRKLGLTGTAQLVAYAVEHAPPLADDLSPCEDRRARAA
ncbi:response regulator transcription factor [Burkholderia cepacia]|uniref:response regulator transcription factor n=1 Tax=Burkholderia cepacia TaxID=292 RepID=UPI001FC8E529|nr:helix-turn-helix transcriptional regulator [Burkholderia cepacia]